MRSGVRLDFRGGYDKLSIPPPAAPSAAAATTTTAGSGSSTVSCDALVEGRTTLGEVRFEMEDALDCFGIHSWWTSNISGNQLWGNFVGVSASSFRVALDVLPEVFASFGYPPYRRSRTREIGSDEDGYPYDRMIRKLSHIPSCCSGCFATRGWMRGIEQDSGADSGDEELARWKKMSPRVCPPSDTLRREICCAGKLAGIEQSCRVSEE